jgi:hypothetical protein
MLWTRYSFETAGRRKQPKSKKSNHPQKKKGHPSPIYSSMRKLGSTLVALLLAWPMGQLGKCLVEQQQGLSELAVGTASCDGDLTVPGAGLSDDVTCEHISGSLVVTHVSGLETLDTLRFLKRVDGDVIIRGNDALRDMQGLAALASIGGSLDLSHNRALQSFAGLESISSVGGNINVQHNGVAELASLASLTRVGGDLTLLPLGSDELRVIHLHGGALPPSCYSGRGLDTCLGADERTVHVPVGAHEEL